MEVISIDLQYNTVMKKRQHLNKMHVLINEIVERVTTVYPLANTVFKRCFDVTVVDPKEKTDGWFSLKPR